MSGYDADLIIVGAGPVGMSAAIAAAQRGRSVLIFERRQDTDPAGAKCNTVAARTMETFRRFGIADEVAAAGLPDDFHTDVILATALNGPEFHRVKLPSRNERGRPEFADSKWRSAEPMVRVSQIYLEPVLQKKMISMPEIMAHFGSEVVEVTQDEHGATARIELADGTEKSVTAPYILGCDGARSMVRHAIGTRLTGDAEIARTRSTLIRAPGINGLMGDRRRSWMSWIVNHEARGIVVAIDGKDTWLIHRALARGETDFESVDFHGSIRALLGVDDGFSYEVLHHEDWIGRRMVAEKMRDRRLFLAGDAAHLWIPFAGYGMNAGIADGVNAVWLICNVLDGWADPAILDAYQAERHPITEQVSRHAMDSMVAAMDALGKGTVPRAFGSRYNPVGAAMRSVMGRKLAPINEAQFLPEGLNFGYYYGASPIIVGDGTSPPDFTMDHHTPSTVPGCRLPHFWIGDVSIYDRLGPCYTVLCFNSDIDLTPLIDAAKAAAMPLEVVNLPPRRNDPAFQHDLLIVRSDQHVAWRGDSICAQPDSLVTTLCGKAVPEPNTRKQQ